MSNGPRVALIYPPTTDPTSGYHSLSYLDSYARGQGYPAADIIDANIEAFHFSYGPQGHSWLAERLAAPRGDEDYYGYLDGDTARAHLLRVGEPDPEAVRRGVATLQDPHLFYDYNHYQQATDAVIAWMNCLGAIGFPGQFRAGFQVNLPTAMTIGSVPALTDHRALARLSTPFQPYYDEVLIPRLVAGGYDMIGLNITYIWQLPFALWLIHLLRQALPDTILIAGGTEVSDVWKCALDKAMVFTLFAELDAIVVGEGESAYTEILAGLQAGELPVGHPNVRLHPKYGRGRPLPLLHYEPLREIPTPDFSGLPWDLYLSPERFTYYSPTRGCYWNKCTFCDYGLNTDGPTSPWRQDTVETMIRDVTELSRWAKFIYFSVDVLAPATILRFAERVVQDGLDFRWGAEIRLEKYWSDERCELLRRSGCVAISVGFESGNQRVLDLIDKGTRPAQVKQTITAMNQAGIGVQIMGFTGFPTETREEAQDSIDFLVDNRDLWTFGGLGEFVLTSGAIVAKQPDRFGISNVRPMTGSGIVRALAFDEPITKAARADVAAAKSRIENSHYNRPWVGGVDTPHSFFYHDRFGPELHRTLERTRGLSEPDEEQRFVANGTIIDMPDQATLAAYNQMYGRPGRVLPTNRLAFRRGDGNILLLPLGTKVYLDLFAEPRSLADAARHAWMMDAFSIKQLWSIMIRQGTIRRYEPSPAGDADADAVAGGDRMSVPRPVPTYPLHRSPGRHDSYHRMVQARDSELGLVRPGAGLARSGDAD